MRRLKAYLLWRRIDKNGDLLRINLVESCKADPYVLLCGRVAWYSQSRCYTFRTKNIVGNCYVYKAACFLYDKFEDRLVIYVSAYVNINVRIQHGCLVSHVNKAATPHMYA